MDHEWVKLRILWSNDDNVLRFPLIETKENECTNPPNRQAVYEEGWLVCGIDESVS